MSIEMQLPSGEDPLLLSFVLVDPRHRQLLGILQTESTPLTERDLAGYLAAREGDKSASDVTDKERQEVQVALHHHYLPKLEQAGLIDRHPEGIVATGQLPLDEIEWTLPRVNDPDIPSWEALAALIARPRRQHIVSVLAGHRAPLALGDLAAELGHEQYSRASNGEEEKHHIQVTLHHIDLPKLDEVGLIEYDRDNKTVIGESALSALNCQTDSGTTGTSDTTS